MIGRILCAVLGHDMPGHWRAKYKGALRPASKTCRRCDVTVWR